MSNPPGEQKLEKSDPGNFIDQVKEMKNVISDFHNQNYHGSIIRSKARILDNSEKPSKFFFKLESTRGRKKLITQIEEDSVRYTKTPDIIDQFRQFYSKLFTTQGVDQDMVNYFLNDLPKFSDLESSFLDEPFSKDELRLAIKIWKIINLQDLMVIPKEFYATFFDLLSNSMLNMYNCIFNDGLLSADQRLSYITLICKDLDNSQLLKNYRSYFTFERRCQRRVIINQSIPRGNQKSQIQEATTSRTNMMDKHQQHKK